MARPLIALIVPVLNRHDLFANLVWTVDYPVRPYVIPNWADNIGVSRSWNQGMFKAMADGYRYAIIANDDVEFQPGSIAKLHKTIIQTGAAMVCPSQIQREDTGLIPGSDFCCFMVDIPQLLEKVGEFDENFIKAYFEDNDYDRRMVLAGVDRFIDTGNYIFHHGSATQYANPSAPVVPSHDFEANRNYFIRKWGGTPGQETYLTPFGDPNRTVRDWR